MTSLIMLACGCLMASLGALTLSGRLGVNRSHPREAGWGFILMGAAPILDGLPRLAGWSYAVVSDLAGVALALAVLGGLLQVLGMPTLRAGRLLTSPADTNRPELHRATANASDRPTKDEQGPASGDDDPRST